MLFRSHANGCFTAAKFLIPKAKKVYGLKNEPIFLPSPIQIPENVKKSDTPVVCFLGRFDRRKRPEIFFDLAIQFPDVIFEAVGIGRDRKYVERLNDNYLGIKNLRFNGFVDQFSNNNLSEIIGRSWILINTSIREGLPTSFLEAAANGCAILSEIDPDGFTSSFGYLVKNGNFQEGLQSLLSDQNWLTLGQNAREHIINEFSLKNSINNHLEIYHDFLRK